MCGREGRVLNYLLGDRTQRGSKPNGAQFVGCCEAFQAPIEELAFNRGLFCGLRWFGLSFRRGFNFADNNG